MNDEQKRFLEYFSYRYFNMDKSVEIVDTPYGKTLCVDGNRYIRIQDLILRLDMFFMDTPYGCKMLMDVLDIDYIYLSIFSLKNNYVKRGREYKTYIALDENSLLYKIGKSENPEKRIRRSSTFSPFVKLLFVSCEDVEHIIHEKYSDFRKHGEWFDLPKNVLDNIIKDYGFNKYKEK